MSVMPDAKPVLGAHSYLRKIKLTKKWKALVLFTCISLSVVSFRFARLDNDKDQHLKHVEFISASAKASHHIVDKTLKYLLIWTHNFTDPFYKFKSGRSAFVDAKCPFNNCFVTNDRAYLPGGYVDFDAIIFHGPEFTYRHTYVDHGMPAQRRTSQRYIFACVESAQNYPACDKIHDGYFNWTWTYKLDSDVVWNYITVRDLNGTIVAPHTNPAWVQYGTEQYINKSIETVLTGKKKAAAWFVSNCNPKSKRDKFVKDLREELLRHSYDVDVYGKCGSMQCPSKNQTEQDCRAMLQREYYFYLAFENSFSEDYVTEKVLHGYENLVVPIVFGSANYTRFLPPGSYVDARELGARRLAAAMLAAIRSSSAYRRYFRWSRHYSLEPPHARADSNPLCRFCAALNSRAAAPRSHPHFRRWWNGPEEQCRH